MSASTRQILRRRGGFTLIEMLLALVIGTMILSATAAVFVSTMDGWRRGSRIYSQMQAADKIGGLIERHLRAALSPADDKQAVFSGEDLSQDEDHPGHRLTLISSAPGRFPRNLPETDSCEIAFEYDPEGVNGMVMRIQCPPDGIFDDGGYLVALSPLIIGFRVIYFDGEKWKETWNASSLPQAVEFTLLLDRTVDGSGATAAASGESGASASSSAAPSPASSGPAAASLPGEGPLKISRLVWLPMGKGASEEAATPAPTPAPQATGGEGSNATGGAGAASNQGGGQ